MSKMIALWLSVFTLCGLQTVLAEVSAGLSTADSEPSFSKGLTYGEVRQWHRQAGKSAILALSSIHFGTFPLKTLVQRHILVHNPTSSPLLIQFHVLPNDIESMLWHGCNTTKTLVSAFDLDDEECENCQEAASPWCSSDLEEVEIVRNLSSQLPPAVPSDLSVLDKVAFQLRSHRREKPSFRLDALPRYKYGKGEWVLQSPEVNGYMLQRGVQGFFLAGRARNAVVIAPGQSETIGTVCFEANAIGDYRGKLLIRTNASIYDALDLSAEAQYARIAFRREISHRQSRPKVRSSAPDMSTLDLSVLEEDVSQQIDRITERLPAVVKVTKYFEAENVGTTELRIAKILLNGHSCSLMGLTIEDCEQTFVLQPNQTMEIAISYEFSFVQRELQAFLWLFTEEDGFYLPLKLTVYVEELGKYAQLRAVQRDSVNYFLSELFTLLDCLISLGYLLLVAKEVLIKQKLTSFRLFSNRQMAICVPFLPQVTLKPPNLIRKCVPEPEEPDILPCPQPTIPEDQPKSTLLKPKKCKKAKVSILKFAPSGPNSGNKSETGESQEIIATNRLLLAKKAQKQPTNEALASEVESEKPGGRDSQLFESTTTTHSEDGETDGEYLDCYKTRQGLFSGFALRMTS